jgi:LytS/YehU family sensor histidine kinase
VYEVLYLTKEREEDTERVEQLDHELTRAGIMALRNELDPHFIFNSLTALSHLISNDPFKADLFNRKLAEVYKYFLINREKEFITLSKEMDFVKDYFFLLSIRHDHKLQLHLDIAETDAKQFLVIPYTLQILVENAIKHNELSHDHPLPINISIADNFLIVTNTKTGKKLHRESTGIGLKNLGTQYRLLTKSKIEIKDTEEKFTVKLPLQPVIAKEITNV